MPPGKEDADEENEASESTLEARERLYSPPYFMKGVEYFKNVV
tara:strand:- start:98 stop:226 length:129 start_codon:yes stop_codon:yes gene_type:complete